MDDGVDKLHLAHVCMPTRLYYCEMSYLYFYHSEGPCSTLTNPSNGVVTWTGLTSGSTATYTCNSGYELIGNTVRTCQNGRWSGQAPTCSGMTTRFMMLIYQFLMV